MNAVAAEHLLRQHRRLERPLSVVKAFTIGVSSATRSEASLRTSSSGWCSYWSIISATQ